MGSEITGGRITPAGAGKTNYMEILMNLHKDHPRRCGENFSDISDCINAAGSPPQVRGKHICKLIGRAGNWITPAGAGKTCPELARWGLE